MGFSNRFPNAKKILHSAFLMGRFKFAVMALVIGTFPQWAAAASLSTGADFLLEIPGARPAGMGEAFSAVADDLNALSYNPAALSGIALPQAGYERISFPQDMHYDFVGLALPTANLGVFSLGYLGFGVADFNSTADPLTPAVNYQDMAFTGAWGITFDFLDVGVAMKYLSRQVDNLSGSGVAWDVGLRYHLSPFLTLAASGLNLGPPMNLTGSSEDPLPATLDVGAAWRVLEEGPHSLTLASDAFLYLTTATQHYGVGAEYWYDGKFALRSGWLLNSQTQGFSVGAGVRINFFELDYAFQPLNLLGDAHRLSATVMMKSPWEPGGPSSSMPRGLKVEMTEKGMEISWEKPESGAEAYKVSISTVDGRQLVSKAVQGTNFTFADAKMGVPYRLTVSSVGGSGEGGAVNKEVMFGSPSDQKGDEDSSSDK